ncbi:hypothetical protein T492DRAFT_871304 [Pavlovales sp. CCMP2436]|nr:hypothetical protein T492DRAFT_871304 [Pavlovales sp. CCMP2436]
MASMRGLFSGARWGGRAARAGAGAGALALTAGWSIEAERYAACYAKGLASAAVPAAAVASASSGMLAERALLLYQYEICPFCNKSKIKHYSTRDVSHLPPQDEEPVDD